MDWIRSHRWALSAGVLGVVLVVAAFFVGKGSADTHSGELSELQAELDQSHEQTQETEQKLATEREEVQRTEGEAKTATARAAEAEEELASERSFKGNGERQQAANQKYETDFPWGAAGEAGNFIFKPTSWEQDGAKWVLTVEAKNVSHEPKQPFCGGGESVVIDAAQNNYTGEAVIGSGSADCGEELQPGSTATYKAEFKIASSAVPVEIAIYGEYEQEEEAKTWELPH